MVDGGEKHSPLLPSSRAFQRKPWKMGKGRIMEDLYKELTKLATDLPDITLGERVIPYGLGEPVYRAIYAPHGKKLEEYNEGKKNTKLLKLLGGILGGVGGAKLGVKLYGPRGKYFLGLPGIVLGAGAGPALRAHKAPEELRQSLGEV